MKKITNFFVLITFLLLFSTRLESQEITPKLRVSLLTCSRNGDVSSAFGHSAVRITDSISNRDLVFNYGTFNFNEPNFLLKFLRGDLDYMLAPGRFSRFIQVYKTYDREVVEEVLNLTDLQKVELLAFLLNNSKPENSAYRYDFLIDNCATRIRDLFNSEDFVCPAGETEFTFRDNLNIYISDRKWLQFGIDLLLTGLIDRKISFQEEMFLPVPLSRNLGLYYNVALEKNLLEPPVTLNEKQSYDSKWVKFFQPLIVFSLLLAIAIMLFFFRRTMLLKLATFYYLIFGIGGVILTFMWFGTNHIWTEYNWNLLWMNPLFLIPVFMKKGNIRRWTILLLALPAILLVIFMWLVPQQINCAIVPLVLTLALMSFAEFKVARKVVGHYSYNQYYSRN